MTQGTFNGSASVEEERDTAAAFLEDMEHYTQLRAEQEAVESRGHAEIVESNGKVGTTRGNL